MFSSLFVPLVAAGFAVAFFHAAIPTHWLPFVLAGRGQKWSTAKTLGITGLAGFGHVLATAFLGLLVVWLGIETSKLTGDVFPYIAGGLLIAAGLALLVQHFRHRHDDGGHHHHAHGGLLGRLRRPALAEHPGAPRTDRTVILTLVGFLALSPCETFLPVYLSGVQLGWTGFVLLSVVLSVATAAGMIFFTWLSLTGLARLDLAFLDRLEHVILGLLLCAVGVVVMLFET